MNLKPGRIHLSPPHMGGEEKKFIEDAFACNYIAPLGPQVVGFEREFCEKTGFQHAVAVSSGTAAMHLALRLLGVGEGDEVFASSLTFIGSVSPVIFQGGVPVFVDSNASSWNMDPDLLADELKRCRKRGCLPKAVVPTDLYGQCIEMERIMEICTSYEVPLILDSAEAMGATYMIASAPERGNARRQSESVHAGIGAKAAVFSFNGNKIITTSGGGMLASDDAAFIEKARFLAQQAREPVSHYEHKQIGYNYRMSNVVAAIGRGQLKVLEDRIERKRWVFNYYREALGGIDGIDFMPEAPYGKCTRWLTVILVDPERTGSDRESIRLALEAENIESRPIWKPMHLQPVFEIQSTDGTSVAANRGRYKARCVGGRVSETLFEKGLCLPSGTALAETDLDRVVTVILRTVNSR